MAIFRNLLRRLRRDRPDKTLRFRVPNMRMRQLKSGAISYYWRPPRRALREQLPIHFEALGTDFEAALARARFLNRLLASFPAEQKTKRNQWQVARGCALSPVTAESFAVTDETEFRGSSGVTSAASVTADAEQMELVA